MHIVKIISQEDHWPFYYRSFLTVIIHRLVWVMTHPFGFDGEQAVALSSSLGGSLAVLALWRLCRHPLFLFVNICSGSFLVFVGHVETYSWVGVGFLWTVVLMREVLLDRVSGAVLMAVFWLSTAFHMLMFFYLPVVAIVLMRSRPPDRHAILYSTLAFAAAVLILPLCFSEVGATEIGLDRLVPLFEPFAPNQRMTFFSHLHWEILWFFLCSADLMVKAPLALLTLCGVPGWENAFRCAFDQTAVIPIDRLGWPVSFLLLAAFGYRIRGLFLKLLLLSSGIGVGWTIVWNPDWGMLDWDLFSQYALPLHLLVGLLILPRREAYIVDPVYRPDDINPPTEPPQTPPPPA